MDEALPESYMHMFEGPVVHYVWAPATHAASLLQRAAASLHLYKLFSSHTSEVRNSTWRGSTRYLQRKFRYERHWCSQCRPSGPSWQLVTPVMHAPSSCSAPALHFVAVSSSGCTRLVSQPGARPWWRGLLIAILPRDCRGLSPLCLASHSFIHSFSLVVCSSQHLCHATRSWGHRYGIPGCHSIKAGLVLRCRICSSITTEVPWLRERHPSLPLRHQKQRSLSALSSIKRS